jgi:4-amino-4-deoxy-L-arabinose transferase-like glycosyltransferase
MMPRVRANLPLALVLLLALALRLWGIGWGLPSATHYFSYHPDESMVLLYAMSMNVFQGHLLPHFYNYGSLQLYLVLLANTLFFVFGHGALIVQNYATQTSQWAQQFLVGRLLTVGMGVGTVWATYALGRCIWGIRAGLAGALILAILPLHVQHSHWLTVDVPATFWATISLVWSARLLTGDPKPLRAALLAGMFAGFAIATKYNLALALLPLAFAALCPPASSVSDEPRPRRKYLVAGILGCVAAALAFLVTCPGVFLEWPVFLGGIRYEAYHVQHLPDLAFLDTGNGFLYQIRTNFDAGLGLPLLVLCACALGYALWRRERGDGLLAAFALPYFLVISLAEVRYARYIIPLLPILAVWSGRVLAELSRGARIPLGKAALALAGAALRVADPSNGCAGQSRCRFGSNFADEPRQCRFRYAALVWRASGQPLVLRPPPRLLASGNSPGAASENNLHTRLGHSGSHNPAAAGRGFERI